MFIQTKHNYIVGNSYEVGKYIKVKINFDALDKASWKNVKVSTKAVKTVVNHENCFVAYFCDCCTNCDVFHF